MPSGHIGNLAGMRADQIQARAVAKIVLVALFWAGVAVLVAIALLHTRTTLQWVAAAVFLALALDPAVNLVQRAWPGEGKMPRVLGILLVYLAGFAALVFLVLQVFPPIVHDIEGLAHKLPRYVHDFEDWANNNKQFQDLNSKYQITAKLSQEAATLPSHLSSGASTIGSFTVSISEHLLAALTIIALTFFLLLDGSGMVQRGTGRLPELQRDRGRRIAARVAEVVKAYVSVNLLLAIAAGFLTWGFLQAEGFHLAVPLAVLVAFLDLIPLIGLTVGGFSVFAVLMIDGGPGDAIVWLILFLVYQQAQDRVIQPILYKGGALKVTPAVAIVAVIVGAELAGVLGALLAIPAAASLGVVIDELVLSGPPGGAAEPEPGKELSPALPERLAAGAGEALLGSPLLPVLVEELRPDRVRLAQPEPAHQSGDRHEDAPDRHAELLLSGIEEGEDDAHQPDGADDGLDLIGDLRGHFDPAAQADQQHARDGRGDDHRVDRPPALLLPVDVLQVEPECEFVEREPRPDPEEHRDDLPPRAVRRDRDGD